MKENEERISAARIVAAVVLATIALIALSPVVSPLLSQVFPSVSDGECERCHGGFEPFEVIEDSPSEVPGGDEFEYRLMVNNPWQHEVRTVSGTIDLSNSPTLSTEGTDSWENEETFTGSVRAFSTETHSVEIDQGAVSALFVLDGDEGIAGMCDLDMVIVGPSGSRFRSQGEGPDEEVNITREDLVSEGPGTWEARIQYVFGRRSIPYTLDIQVSYGGGEDVITVTGGNIRPGSRTTLVFPVTAGEIGDNTVSYSVSGTCYYEHEDQGVDDEDTYVVNGTTEIRVGTDYLYSAPDLSMSTSQMLWVLGRITGFSTAALFIVSFLTGGNIRPLKRYMDKKIGGRIRIHCVASYLAVASAFLHMILLYTGYYQGTWRGIYLGGGALLLMLIISLTGIFKSKMVRKMGERNWRRIHLYLSIATILLFVIHGIIEGTDLAFLRFW